MVEKLFYFEQETTWNGELGRFGLRDSSPNMCFTPFAGYNKTEKTEGSVEGRTQPTELGARSQLLVSSQTSQICRGC